jgi:hypothetical protein
MTRLRVVRQQLREIEQQRLRKLEAAAPAKKGPHAMVGLIARVIGIGIETADMLVNEILSRQRQQGGRPLRWSRHLGASLSMRIIASWFGSCRPTAYKYASVIIRHQRAPLGIDACEIRLSQSTRSSRDRERADSLR